MHSPEVRAHLEALALTPGEAASLLGVGLRTMRRWTQPHRLERKLLDHRSGKPPGDMPGQGAPTPEGKGAALDGIAAPAEQALRAWLKLHRIGEHWRPNGLALQHVDVAAAMDRVRGRSGPATHWQVDLAHCVARKTGRDRVQVSFIRHAHDRFTLQSFWSAQDGDARQACQSAGFGETLLELVDDACAGVARRLAGETELRWPRLVLGAAGLVPGAVEMRDVSWRSVMKIRLPLAALRTAWTGDLGDGEALTLVTRHQVLLAELASEIHARREPTLLADGTRMLEIHAGDLALMRGRLTMTPGPELLALEA